MDRSNGTRGRNGHLGPEHQTRITNSGKFAVRVEGRTPGIQNVLGGLRPVDCYEPAVRGLVARTGRQRARWKEREKPLAGPDYKGRNPWKELV